MKGREGGEDKGYGEGARFEEWWVGGGLDLHSSLPLIASYFHLYFVKAWLNDDWLPEEREGSW